MRKDIRSLDKFESVTVFKCVLVVTERCGATTILDMNDGHIYYSSSSQDRLSKNGIMYKTKAGAVSETSGPFLRKVMRSSSSRNHRYDRAVAVFGTFLFAENIVLRIIASLLFKIYFVFYSMCSNDVCRCVGRIQNHA